MGVVLVAAWALLTPSGRTSLAPLGIAVAYFAGHALGHGLVAWRETSRATPAGGPRIARTSTPRHTDYVARHERWGGWGLAGAAIAIAVGLVVVDAAGVDLDALPWVLLVATGVVPVLVMAGYEVAAARLLRRRQVAATTLDLAWDDALRAPHAAGHADGCADGRRLPPGALLSSCRNASMADGGAPVWASSSAPSSCSSSHSASWAW